MARGPFARFEWMLALRYLRPRRKEGFISVIAGFSFLGIALGVMTLIIVMAVMNGFRTELMNRILGLHGHVIVQAYGDGLADFDGIAENLRRVPGVTRVMPLVEGQVMVSAHDANSGAIVRGLRKADLDALTVVSGNIKAGSLDQFGAEDGLVIGTRLARQFGLGVGDDITLLSARGTVTPFGTVPRVKAYPILATFEIGMSEYDSSFVFMPLDEAQRYFNIEGGVSALEIMVKDPDDMDSFRPGIAAALKVPARIVDWRQLNQSFFDALQVERNVMFLILTLIIVVAALNIISGLIMLVKEKGSAIAILRTMGASQGAVLRIFFIAGASIGTVGTLGGFAGGVLFCRNIETIRQWLIGLTGTELFSPEVYFLSQIPAEINNHEVAAVVLMALALSFLATLFPAWRAARLDPVEALRYE